MCEYCDDKYQISIIEARLENEQTYVYVDFTAGLGPTLAMDTVLGLRSTFHSAKINFCPMCGRDLRGATMARLYISGPVTGKPNDNRKAFEEARRELRHWYMVSIPHEYVDAETTHEEAMAILLHQLTDRTYSYRKGKCANLYDGVALLPGWEQSEGARLERAVADACGIPCKTVDEWLEEAQ